LLLINLTSGEDDVPQIRPKITRIKQTIPAVLNASRWQVYPPFLKVLFEIHSETVLPL